MSRFALLPMVLLVAGCSGGLHSDAPPGQIYILRAAPSVTDDAAARVSREPAVAALPGPAPGSPTLQLSRPSANPGLATDRIVIVQSDRRLDYYAGSRWAAALPDVVGTLAIDTLRASGNWAAVQDSTGPLASDYLLHVGIRRFEADYTGAGAAPRIYVTLDCTLTRRADRELLTSFAAEGVADAAENRLAAVVAAFDKAANAAVAEVVARSAAAVRGAPSYSSAP